MGTRIHKIMGYGFKLSKTDRKTLWRRLDDGSYEGEVAAIMEAARTAASAVGRRTLHLSLECPNPNLPTTNYPRFLSDIIRYADHPDSDNGFHVVMPPSMWRSWYRFSNDLDHVEYFFHHPQGDLVTVVHQIKSPLYPYVNWMHPNTGERLQDYSPIWGDKEEFVQQHGVEPVPHVPEAVQVIADLFGFDWKTFRPMLVTWWC